MKIPRFKGAERLAFFRELYENARMNYRDTLDELERHMNQYKGTNELDGSAVRASTVRNITYELIESQVSSDIPLPKVDAACYSERRERCARSIERLLLSLRDKLPFEEMNDVDERYTYVYGGSVWYAEWDNEMRLGREVGGVRIHCLAPRDFIPQPAVYALRDMDYCFLRFSTTKSELMRRYKVSEEELPLAECEEALTTATEEGECVPVIICFYKDEAGEVGKYIFSGELTLSDMPRAYHRKTRVCRTCGATPELCTCERTSFRDLDVERERVSITLPTQVGEQTAEVEVPYYTPKSFPIVIRRNTSGDRVLLGQSDCEYIRPEQQAINKLESRILQKLLRAGITPIVPEDARITLDNSVFGQLIRMKPGESAAQYGKVDTTPDISQDIAEAERLYDHAKRILGISDALVGINGDRVESGYSRQLQIAQATGRLESKRKMKHTAYAALDRIIFELYLAYADEPRALVYKDAYGRIHNAEFCRYDFLEVGTDGEVYFDDAYLFSVDLNGGAEYQREALWKRNLENLKAGTLGDPSSPVTLLRYWQCQERAHYPFARENVEYFTIAVSEGGDTGEPKEQQELRPGT